MIEIGRNKHIRWKDRSTGEPRERFIKEEVRRVTHEKYGHSSVHRRKLVVILGGDDLVTIKPLGTRQGYSGNVYDIYRQLLLWSVNRKRLEKARQRKVKLADQRERRAIQARDRKLKKEIRNGA